MHPPSVEIASTTKEPVIAFGLSQGDTRQRRIDVEASADVRVSSFPAAKGFFTGHQIRITAGIVNYEGLAG